MKYKYFCKIFAVIIVSLYSSESIANKIVLNCDSTEKFESNLIKKQSNQKKFGILIDDTSGVLKVNIFGMIYDGHTEDGEQEFVDGSCVDRFYPLCDMSIKITDSAIYVSSNKHNHLSKDPKNTNSYFDFDNQTISINRYNGTIKWDHYWDPDTRNPPGEGFWSHHELLGKCIPETQRKF